MFAVKFTIELDIRLFFLLWAALPQLVTHRETKTHRRGRSKRACRRAPERAARARGKHSGRPAKLTETQVRALRAGGESISELVAGFGVSLATVYRALREDTQAQAS
jgi:DNA invertase Pin-like site-specific DNA recombinase